MLTFFCISFGVVVLVFMFDEFLISGIFPLVVGAGIFWTSYNIVSNQPPVALHTGFAALKATVAIALGILAVMELNRKGRIGKWMKKNKFSAQLL